LMTRKKLLLRILFCRLSDGTEKPSSSN